MQLLINQLNQFRLTSPLANSDARIDLQLRNFNEIIEIMKLFELISSIPFFGNIRIE